MFLVNGPGSWRAELYRVEEQSACIQPFPRASAMTLLTVRVAMTLLPDVGDDPVP